MEKIIIPIRCYRSFVQSHPELNFIYSNDYFNKGCEGQAWFFANEPNTFMLPTCYKLCQSQRHFHDGRFEHAKQCMDEWFAKLPSSGIFIPMPKMGLGCSRLKELAPECYKYFVSLVDKVKYPNIEFVYASQNQ